MASAIPNPTTPSAGVRQSVLSIPAFRRLWNAMAFSSFGDWLGLLATTALAQQLAGGNYATANFAIAGVFIARLLPSVILGPLAGVIADKFDRKKVMVIGDILRALLFLSIPIVGNYFWLYTATVLIECVTLFWSPAKEATVPNLVPKNRLENANQVSLFAAYGTAPIAAILFSLLSIFITGISAALSLGQNSAVDLALYINALSFLFSAYTISQLEIPKEHLNKSDVSSSLFSSLLDGGKFVSSSKIVRGLIVGLLGAFVAAGAVIGLARTFVGDLAGGDAAYGVLFGAVFTGLAAGIALGPKVFAQFSRRRLFGAALTSAGFLLIVLSLLQNLVLAIFVVVILGFFSGVSWVTGFTMLGMEVTDELRGRVFAFIQSLVRVSLVGVLAVAPLAAAAIGEHDFNIGQAQLTYNGAAFTMLGGGLIAMFVGILSYHQMKDRPGVSFWSDIVNAFKGELGSITVSKSEGLFISFEGGEGSGKSTQSKLLKEWFENEGRSVVLTREPGGTTLGKNLRKILLDNETGDIAPRSEALLYAADRAHHVYSLIRPALERGDVVITDRYFDSSIAYQGAGRVLSSSEVARINRWATESLFPTLTIILDQPAEIGLSRIKNADRLESESIEFHNRVRQEYLQLAAMDPERYLVLDAQRPIIEIHQEITARISAHISRKS
ncbi:MAG: dTMP kinase [Candidatus Nanopelagicaceae bacterium]|nr:dTMP kinase [Candidatus Nanopelagicaceae bacterium]